MNGLNADPIPRPHHPHHDRLDLKLHSSAYMVSHCGGRNVSTGRAEYCDFACPTLMIRMLAGEDVTVPTPPAEPADESGLVVESAE